MVAVGLIAVLPLTSYADTANGSPDPGSPGVFLYNAGTDSSGTPSVGPRPGGGPCDGTSGDDPTGPAITEAVAAGLLYFIGDVPQEVESFTTGGAGETDFNSSPDPDIAAVNTGLTTVDDYGFIGNTGDDASNYDAGTGGDIRLSLDANDDEPNAPAGPIDLIIPDGVAATGQISDTSGGTTLNLDGSEIFIFEDAATSGMTITLLGDGDPVTINIDDYQRNPDAPGEADDTLIAIDLDTLAGFNGTYVGEIIITDDDIPTSPPGRSDCDTSQTANVIDTSLEIDAVATRTDTVLLGVPAVDIEKATNGSDADNAATAVPVIAGQTVTWTYVVTNTGEVPLSDVTVVDDQLADADISCANGSNVVPGPVVPGGSFTCEATGVAGAAAYTNVSTVTGTPEAANGSPAPQAAVTDADPSNYVPQTPSITIEKDTNGVQADLPANAVALTLGEAITWTYVVTNNGPTNLISADVTDDQGVAVTCVGGNPIPQLAPNDSVICTGVGTAALTGATPYANIGSVSATPADASFAAIAGAAAVNDADPSHYVVSVSPAIDIEKLTNGEQADDPTGPQIVVGDTVTWTYVVTNTGDTALTNITVTDDQIAPGSINCGGSNIVAGPISNVAPNNTFTCDATGVATSGQYTNVSSVSGVPSDAAGASLGLPNVTDSDPSNYIGIVPSILLEKSTNSQDADTAAEAVVLEIGDPITWNYIVTNNGPVTLANVTVVDDQGVTVSCNEGTGNVINDLAPAETVTCSGAGTAEFGSYTNLGSVSGQPVNEDGQPVGERVDDTDPSNYIADADPAITIQKSTNEQDADTPTGPTIAVGGVVTWIYEVTNTGDVPLSSVTVNDDDPSVVIDCGGGSNTFTTVLIPGAVTQCEATGVATSGQYANTGDVVGTPSDDAGTPLPGVGDVTAEDPSHYFGGDPGLDIEKATNGVDADTPADAPAILAGEAVSWTYVVTNPGNQTLLNVEVADSDPAVIVSCGQGTGAIINSLAPGEEVICNASGIAVADGLYANIGSVVGQPIDDEGNPIGDPQTDEDPSHYVGADPVLTLKKFVDGDDAQDGSPITVDEGDTVTWTYVVTNDGTTNLVRLTVVDDQAVSVDCGDGTPNIASLAAGVSVTCAATGEAIAGPYRNLGTVTGTPADAAGEPLTDPDGNRLDDLSSEDEANYIGEPPAPNGSIGDLVWLDANNNAAFDSGEVGIAGVEVNLAGPGGFTSTMVTDSDGFYQFTDLAFGDYTVTVNPATLPAGYVQTFDEDAPLDNESTTTLTEQAPSDPNQDFGYVPPVLGTIGDTVWFDANENGVLDPGESGIEDVTITITDSSGATQTATTDANGQYLFDELPFDTYTVRVDQSTLPAGFVPTFDDDAPFDGESTTTLTAAAPEDLDQDFGYVEPLLGSIGDFVWLDANADGVQDAGETGIEGVTVTLSAPDGTEVTDVTDSSGLYLFTGLDAGTYTITVDTASAALDGLSPTGDFDGGLDSTSETTIEDGESDLDQDFGYVAAALDIEKATNSADADTAADAVTVTVDTPVTWTYVVTNNSVVAITDVTVTDDKLTGIVCDGSSDNTVASLAAGDSVTCAAEGTLSELGPYTNIGSVTGDDPLGNELTDSDPSNANAVDEEVGSLGDFVWFDTDGDGAQDPDEEGIEGVELTLTRPDGTTTTVTTDANGEYTFPGLVAGEYTIEVTDGLPAGVTQTIDADGGNDNKSTYTLAAGEDNTEQDFGYEPARIGAIGDTVWFDLDGDGVLDANEEGIANVTLELVDADDQVVATEVTDANGRYTFADVPGADGYTVRVDATTLPAGATQVSDPDETLDGQSELDLADGEINTVQDFGYVLAGTIGDRVWFDANADGIQDADEEGIEGVKVDLKDADGTVIDTDTTDGDGAYLFENVPAGTGYTVMIDTGTFPDNVFQTADPDDAFDNMSVVDLELGESNLDQDFGYVNASRIGDFIFVDANGNGLQDPGEEPVSGATVNLWSVDADGAPDRILDTVTTGPNGQYGFLVAPGQQYVLQVQVAGVQLTAANAGDDDLADSDVDPSTGFTAILSVGAGVTDLSFDAGIVVAQPGIQIEKATNGNDADEAPGSSLVTGSQVTWTYVVTNTGGTALADVAVNDSREGGISCPKTTLAINETMTCTLTGTVLTGQYANDASVSGTPVDAEGNPIPGLERPADSDPSHYLGVPTATVPATVVPAATPTPVVITVIATPTPVPVPLALTGRNSADLALIAGALIMVGGSFLVIGRRRRDNQA